jgi:hypothetical protein
MVELVDTTITLETQGRATDGWLDVRTAIMTVAQLKVGTVDVHGTTVWIVFSSPTYGCLLAESRSIVED